MKINSTGSLAYFLNPPPDENSANENKSKKKRERRSKEEGMERNYICGCGRSYLSYAALYTHAKTKHDGIFPEGTTSLLKKSKNSKKKNNWIEEDKNCEY